MHIDIYTDDDGVLNVSIEETKSKTYLMKIFEDGNLQYFKFNKKYKSFDEWNPSPTDLSRLMPVVVVRLTLEICDLTTKLNSYVDLT